MILPPPPRSAHQLVVFLVDGTLRDQHWPAAAVDHVVTMAHRCLAASNHHFAWVVFDTTATAVRRWTDAVSGTSLADTVRQLPPGPTGEPATLDAGLAAAYQLSRSFLDQYDDGLPATVDLLAVIGSGGDCQGAGHAEIASDCRVQLAVASFGTPGPSPPGLDLTAVDGPELGPVWLAARQRMAGRRRPHLVLG